MASIDDYDELIATRKLNGVDDGLYESDKNVANMTEEAFNEIIDNFEVVAYLTEYGRKGIKDNVKKLQARIKELEEEKKNKADFVQKYIEVTNLYLNSIPVQKIKDKIEELKQKAISYGHLIDKDEAFKIECVINVLEELLKEK